MHVAQAHARFGQQGVEIVKVGDARQVDDGDVGTPLGVYLHRGQVLEGHGILFGDK